MNRLLLAFLAVPVAVGACGGNDASAPRPASPPASPSYAPAAEKICESMQRDTAGLSGGTTPTDEEFARLLRRWRAGFDKLDALEPPSDQKADVDRMLVSYRNMARAFDELILAEDESVLAGAAGVAVFGHRGSRAARDAGLDACAFFPELKQPPADGQPTYEATRELLPEGARILRDDDVDCNAERSCRFEYRVAGGITARADEARAALRAHGWTDLRSGRSPNGVSWVMANRNDYLATFELVGDVPAPHCTGEITWGCVDSVWVHRLEIPEVLTGG